MNTRFLNFIPISAATVLLATGCGDADPAVIMEEAQKAVVAGNWKQVMTNADELTETAPNDPNTWIFKALACEHTGDMQGALEASARGAELCPESFYCQYNRGRLLFLTDSGDQDAFQFLARAYKLAPTNTDCLQLLVQCAVRMNFDPSSFYSKLNQLAPELAGKVEIQTSMGIYFVSCNPAGTQKWSNGMAFLQNAYNQAPANPIVALNFARALDQSPQYQKAALPVYERYLLLVKNNPEAAGGTAEAEARIKAIQRSSR